MWKGLLSKKSSITILCCVAFITVFFIAQIIRNLRFDYDFDSFFSEKDTEFQFFKEFRDTYENDNDYLLIAVPNNPTIFDSVFLKKALAFSHDLDTISEIRNVKSIINLQDIIIVKNSLFGSESPFNVPYIHHKDYTRLQKDSSFIFSRPELIGSFINTKADHLVFIVETLPEMTANVGIVMMDKIKKTLTRYQFENVKLAGKTVAQTDYVTRMQVEFIVFAGVAFILIILFLYISFRSFWGIWIPTLTLVVCVIWAVGTMTVLGFSVNILTILLPTIMFIVGISDVIHIFSKYLELLRNGYKKTEAIKATIKEVGFATLLTSVTTAIGFATLLTAGISAISDFGIYTAIGVILAFVVAFTLLPAILYLLPAPTISNFSNNKLFWNKSLHRFLSWILRHKLLAVLLSSAVVITSIGGIYLIEENAYLVGEVEKDDPLRDQFFFFEEEFGGARPFEIVVEIPDSNLNASSFAVWQELYKLEEYLSDTFEVNHITSPLTFVKGLNRSYDGGTPSSYKLPIQKRSIRKIQKRMNQFHDKKPFNEFIREDQQQFRISGRLNDIGSKEFSIRKKQFDAFVDENINLEIIHPKITGSAFLIDRSNDELSRNMMGGLLIAFIIVSIIMGILYRSLRIVLISLIPNIIPLLIIGGVMGFAGVDLRASTAIIFTIAFGIAVDDTIHFMSKLKLELLKGKSKLYAIKRTFISTGKAIIVTSIILVTGFISMLLSSFEGTFYTGLLVSITLLFAVLADLLLLPLLLIYFYREDDKKSHK